jgi:hypothetical protein
MLRVSLFSIARPQNTRNFSFASNFYPQFFKRTRAALRFPFVSLALAGKLRRRGNAAPTVVGRAGLLVRRHFGRGTSAAPFAARGGPGRQVSVARSSEIRNWPKETKGNKRGRNRWTAKDRKILRARPGVPRPPLSASCAFFGHPVSVFGFTRPAEWQPDLQATR